MHLKVFKSLFTWEKTQSLKLDSISIYSDDDVELILTFVKISSLSINTLELRNCMFLKAPTLFVSIPLGEQYVLDKLVICSESDLSYIFSNRIYINTLVIHISMYSIHMKRTLEKCPNIKKIWYYFNYIYNNDEYLRKMIEYAYSKLESISFISTPLNNELIHLPVLNKKIEITEEYTNILHDIVCDSIKNGIKIVRISHCRNFMISHLEDILENIKYYKHVRKLSLDHNKTIYFNISSVIDIIISIIKDNTNNLTKLDLSNNEIHESYQCKILEAMQTNNRITTLKLSGEWSP